MILRDVHRSVTLCETKMFDEEIYLKLPASAAELAEALNERGDEVSEINDNTKMKPVTPIRSIKQFEMHLENALDSLDAGIFGAAPEWCDQMAIAEMVDSINRLACRFGAAEAVSPAADTMTAKEGMVAIGRIYAWVRKRNPSELMTIEEVAAALGKSSRTVWRLVSSGEVPAPTKLGGSTVWRRTDIEAMIDLLGSN